MLVLGSEGGEVEVPLRAFQCDVDNLMVGGRCMSGDHISHCLTRNIKCCMLTGQSCGVIAATCIASGQSVWTVEHADVARAMEDAALTFRATAMPSKQQ